MINYELAKELKDAGFPQQRHYDIKDYLPEPLPDGSYDKDDFVAAPTLEELIEACGCTNFSLETDSDKGWAAFADFEPLNPQKYSKTGSGSTPAEAVAKLWLSLNPKPN